MECFDKVGDVVVVESDTSSRDVGAESPGVVCAVDSELAWAAEEISEGVAVPGEAVGVRAVSGIG